MGTVSHYPLHLRFLSCVGSFVSRMMLSEHGPAFMPILYKALNFDGAIQTNKNRVPSAHYLFSVIFVQQSKLKILNHYFIYC